MSTPNPDDNRLKIAIMKAQIRQMELDDLRASILATEPGWLSEASKYMVSVNATGTTGSAEITTYRGDQAQSSGNLSRSDVFSLSDYLATLTGPVQFDRYEVRNTAALDYVDTQLAGIVEESFWTEGAVTEVLANVARLLQGSALEEADRG